MKIFGVSNESTLFERLFKDFENENNCKMIKQFLCCYEN